MFLWEHFVDVPFPVAAHALQTSGALQSTPDKLRLRSVESISFMNLSVVIITFNEEANLGRTLASVKALVADGKGEIIVLDSGSSDRTVEIAKSFGAQVFVEPWKGFAAQKNSAIDKATGDWILSLDADEELDHALQQALQEMFETLNRLSSLGKQAAGHSSATEAAAFETDTKLGTNFDGLWIPRKNEFLGRWMKHGGFWPDPKLRLFRRGRGRFEDRAVHEDVKVEGNTRRIQAGALLHHSYPTISDYIEHMNRYSSLGAEMVVAKGKVRFSAISIVVRPIVTFIYNYFLRLGFLDGREGLLLHLNHAVYVSWKYAKAWELSRKQL
jgi:glycosyltransferase involved in cell wall biosynthesis